MKKLNKTKKLKTHYLSVRLCYEDMQKVKLNATRQELTVAEYIRSIIKALE